MKRETLAGARKWLLGSVAVAAFVYSVFALTVSPMPAYASSCNCTEEEAEAVTYCAPYGGVFNFVCPAGNPPAWAVECKDGVHADAEYCSDT